MFLSRARNLSTGWIIGNGCPYLLVGDREISWMTWTWPRLQGGGRGQHEGFVGLGHRGGEGVGAEVESW